MSSVIKEMPSVAVTIPLENIISALEGYASRLSEKQRSRIPCIVARGPETEPHSQSGVLLKSEKLDNRKVENETNSSRVPSDAKWKPTCGYLGEDMEKHRKDGNCFFYALYESLGKDANLGLGENSKINVRNLRYFMVEAMANDLRYRPLNNEQSEQQDIDVGKFLKIVQEVIDKRYGEGNDEFKLIQERCRNDATLSECLIDKGAVELAKTILQTDKDRSWIYNDSIRYVARLLNRPVLLIHEGSAVRPECGSGEIGGAYLYDKDGSGRTLSFDEDGRMYHSEIIRGKKGEPKEGERIAIDPGMLKNCVVIAMRNGHYYGVPSFGRNQLHLKRLKNNKTEIACITNPAQLGIPSNGCESMPLEWREIESEDDNVLGESDQERFIEPTVASTQQIQDFSAKLVKDSYLPMRTDSVWRKIRTLEDEDVKRALSLVDVALSLPEVKVDAKSLGSRACKILASTFDSSRKIACDSRVLIEPRSPKAENFQANEKEVCQNNRSVLEKIRTIVRNTLEKISGFVLATSIAEVQNKICNDILENGAVVIAEMQNKKNTQHLHDKTQDTLPSRLKLYSSADFMDGWHESQNTGIEFPKTSIAIGYTGYGEAATRTWSHHVAEEAMASYEAKTIVSIGSLNDYNKQEIIDRAKKVPEGEANLAEKEASKKSSKSKRKTKGKNKKKSNKQTTLKKPATLKGQLVASFCDLSKDEMIKYEKAVLDKIKAFEEKAKELVPNATKNIKQLVGKMLVVFSMSHLFTPNLVTFFLESIKNFKLGYNAFVEIFEKLKVNMNNINDTEWTRGDLEALFGAKFVEEVVNRQVNRQVNAIKAEIRTEGRTEGKIDTLVGFASNAKKASWITQATNSIIQQIDKDELPSVAKGLESRRSEAKNKKIFDEIMAEVKKCLNDGPQKNKTC